MKITFTVPGLPTGKGRPKFTRTGHTYTPEKTRAYEEKVRLCWRTQSGQAFPARTPLRAVIDAYFPIPNGLSKKRRTAMIDTPHTKKCDADNLAKSVLDAMNGCAYADDSAVCELHVTKRYSDSPRVEVLLESIGE